MNILKITVVAAISFSTLTVGVRADDYPTKKCIVTGDQLGGDMGAPIEIKYNGRLVRLCCKGCVKKFNKEPEKYIKILDAAAKAK